MIKQLYIRTVNFIITHFSVSVSLRDFLTWPLASRIVGTDYTEPQTLKAGFKLHAYMEDQLGRFALFYGPNTEYFWEPTTMRLLERLVTDAHEIIIAGSHIGLTALYARKAMRRPGSRVHTFEPIHHLYEVSAENFSLNKELGEVILSQKALGDIPGTVTMTKDRIRSRIIADQSRSDIETESVPVITITDYCAMKHIDAIDLVLLDVEGYEYNALQGMKDILSTHPPKDIIYEISFPQKDNLETALRIERFLKEFGYSCYIIEEAHDPTLERVSKKNSYFTLTTSVVYDAHREQRYFNVFATLRSNSEVAKIL